MDAPSYIELKLNEEVVQVIHASIVPHFGKFVFLTLFAVSPFFFLFVLWRQGSWGIGVFVVWLLVSLVLLGRAYMRWARTVFLVTDMRVVDHEQKGFFHRVLTQANYDQIDEVSVQIKGIAPTVFRYGTLSLKLTGASADIEVSHVGRPDRLANLLNDLRANAREQQHANT
jgi:hypothetical protein